MPLFAIRYTVSGRLRFPLDMLRYDGSHPSTQGDVAVLDAALDAGRDGAAAVTLTHIGPSSKWLPTAERWRFFGWDVLPGTRVQRL